MDTDTPSPHALAHSLATVLLDFLKSKTNCDNACLMLLCQTETAPFLSGGEMSQEGR
jgi:hypothetical protein